MPRRIAPLVVFFLAGCGSGDAVPSGPLADAATSEDTTIAEDSGAEDAFVADTATADTGTSDAFVADTLVADTEAPDTLLPDTYVPDTYVPDTYVPDTFVADTYAPDTFVPDTFVPDTFVADTSAPDTSAPMCMGPGFSSTATSFSLPTGYAKGFWNDFSGDTYCDSTNGYARPKYVVTDLDGDGLDDLVVVLTCSGTLAGSDPDVGKTKWLVYRNVGTGFASTPTVWSLPTGYAKGFFNGLTGDTYCDSTNGYARPKYAVTDLNGDGRPDLVVMLTCSGTLAGTDANVGKTKWWVHWNTGTGFAATATDFALPTGYAKGFFNDVKGDTYCDSTNGYARPKYTLVDLTGSGKPQLVVMLTCSGTLAGTDANVGKTKWWVHANTGTGFANTATDFALPTGYAKGFFNDLAGDTYCDSTNGYARPKYTVVDLTGSGKPQLVVMLTCSGTLAGTDANVGKTKWWVHANSGSGFATTTTDFTLPTGYAKGFYNALSGDTYCDSFNGYARPKYDVVDLVGNGKPDLVVMLTCSGTLAGTDPDVGKTKWLVHGNTGTGFANGATTWCLPAGYAKGFYNGLAGDTYCDSFNGYARPKYRVADLVDAPRLEMVVTLTCSGTLAGSDPDVGKTKWLWY